MSKVETYTGRKFTGNMLHVEGREETKKRKKLSSHKFTSFFLSFFLSLSLSLRVCVKFDDEKSPLITDSERDRQRDRGKNK